MTSTFKGGYTYSLWRGDVTTNTAAEIWHPDAGDRFTTLPNFQLAGDHLDLQRHRRWRWRRRRWRGWRGSAARRRAGRADEWDRYYSLSLAQPNSEARAAHDDRRHDRERDGRRDLRRRQDVLLLHEREGHRAAAHLGGAVGGGEPKQVTTGAGIETYPAPLASGKALATISATWNMPNSVGVWDTSASSQKIVYPDVASRLPDGRARRAAARHHAAGRQGVRDSQSGVRAEGHQARREAAGDDLRARRAGAADAARLSLSLRLSPVLRAPTSGSRARATS